MKKMSKFKLLLLPLLLLSLTGCFRTPEEKVQDAFTKTDEASSAHTDMNINIGMKSEGIEIEIPVVISADIDNKTELAEMDLSVSIFGMKVSTKMYLDMKNNISYSQEEDTWVKSVETDTVLPTTANFTFTNVEEQESTEKEYVYKVTISKETFMNMMGSLETTALEDESYEFINDVVLDIYVDKSTGYVTRIYTDLQDAVKYDAEDVEITSFNMEIIYSNFDKVSVTEIPEEVVENAIDKEVYELQTYATDYISEVEWDNENYDDYSTYTNTNLEYDGPKPESVNLTLNYGTVVSGTIKINGYTMTITDGIVSMPTK